jgi:hypothetical protein
VVLKLSVGKNAASDAGVVLKLSVGKKAASDAASDAVVPTLLWSGGDLTTEVTLGCDKRSTNDSVCGDDLLPDA